MRNSQGVFDLVLGEEAPCSPNMEAARGDILSLRTLTGEPLPERFYVFVNQLSPRQSNLRIAGLIASSELPTEGPDPNLKGQFLKGTLVYAPFIVGASSLQFSSPFLMTGTSHSRVEWDAEQYRQSNFPQYPSRLSAVYAFADTSTCQAVARNYEWDVAAIKEFTVANHPVTRVVKVNMGIVNLARAAYRLSSLDQGTIDRIWKAYWEGCANLKIVVPLGLRERKTLEAGVLWEYLVEGSLIAKQV